MSSLNLLMLSANISVLLGSNDIALDSCRMLNRLVALDVSSLMYSCIIMSALTPYDITERYMMQPDFRSSLY
jgi:hypothetical protein